MKICLILLAVILQVNSKAIYIGVLTMPTNYDERPIKKADILGNYVRWINACGARVIAIHPWQSREEIYSIMDKVNGVLLQGGGVTLKPDDQYTIVTKLIYDRIKELHDQGRSMPLWATCLGFEQVLSIASGLDEYYGTVMTHFDATQHIKNLEFDLEQAKKAQIFKYFSDWDFDNVRGLNILNEQHEWGVSPWKFSEYPILNKEFKITSLAKDRNDQYYIASIESRNYPIYAVQFHPEKTTYDLKDIDVVSGRVEARLANKALGNFFIEKARQNTNSILDDDLEDMEIVDLVDSKPDILDNGTVAFYFYNRKLQDDTKFLG